MKNVINKIKKVLVKLSHLIPTALPIGVTEFNDWADSILEANPDLPNNDSMRFALATMVLHLESTSKVEVNLLIVKLQIPTSGIKSKHFFAQSLRKSASNQIAAAAMHELKEKQQAQMKAEAEAKANEQVPQG